MTINELKNHAKKRRDGRFKQKVTASLHLGFNSSETLCRELKISRSLLRSWLRWDYKNRVLKLISTPTMNKKQQSIKALHRQIAELKKELQTEKLRNEAYQHLVDIAKNEHKIDLRKKPGAERLKG